MNAKEQPNKEIDMQENDYVLLPDPVSLMSATPISIFDS